VLATDGKRATGMVKDQPLLAAHQEAAVFRNDVNVAVWVTVWHRCELDAPMEELAPREVRLLVAQLNVATIAWMNAHPSIVSNHECNRTSTIAKAVCIRLGCLGDHPRCDY